MFERIIVRVNTRYYFNIASNPVSVTYARKFSPSNFLYTEIAGGFNERSVGLWLDSKETSAKNCFNARSIGMHNRISIKAGRPGHRLSPYFVFTVDVKCTIEIVQKQLHVNVSDKS